MQKRINKIALTAGSADSTELILKAFENPAITDLCTAILYGSATLTAYYRKTLNLPLLNIATIRRAEEAKPHRLNLLHCVDDELTVENATNSQQAQQASLKAFQTALNDWQRGAINALLSSNDNTHDDDTQQTQQLLNACSAQPNNAINIWLNDSLRIATPIPSNTADNIQSLTQQLLAFNHSLQQDFLIIRPRIALLSPNPSNQQQNTLPSLLYNAEQQNILLFGPYPLEQLFVNNPQSSFDGLLAPDNRLLITAFENLPNNNSCLFTAELPLIRTRNLNPSHNALRQTLYTTIDLLRNRLTYHEATQNPLPNHIFDKNVPDETVSNSNDNTPDLDLN